MITYVTHSEIEQSKWDSCVEQSLNSRVYAYAWYLNSVNSGWEGLVYGDYEAVMPLTQNRKYFISYLFQPFFTQQLGVFSRQEISQELLLNFIAAIPKKYKFIDIQLNEQNQLLTEKYKIIIRKNYLLNLDKPYEELKKNYNSENKRNLKKAIKLELKCISIPFSEVINFYQMHKGDLTKGIKNHDYLKLSELASMACKQEKLISKGVFSPGGELLSAGIFLIHKHRVTFLLGTTSDSGRGSGAMSYLMDQLIIQYSNQKIFLDFEGSDIPGIERFFIGFGAERQNYYRLIMNRLPWIFRLFKS